MPIKPFIIGEEPTNRSVIKVTVGEKYYIAKASSVIGFVKEMDAQHRRAFRPGDRTKNLYWPIVAEMIKQPDPENPVMTIEPLFSSNNGYLVLKFELEQLSKHFGKKNCINANNVPYVPKTTASAQANKSTWLTPNELMNYSKLLKQYEY